MVDYTNFKEYSKGFKKKLRSKTYTKKLAKELQDYYQATSRKRRFTRLSGRTIERRRRMAEYNTTHSDYSSSRSNLTFSGQLINSIKAFIRRTKGVIELIPTGRRKPYKLKSGRLSKSRPLNRDVVSAQEDMGRFLMIPTKKQREGLIEIIKKHMRQALK